MHFSTFVAVAWLANISHAKQCMNITIPIHLTARTGNYTIPEPTKPLEVTAFIQDYLRPGTNLSEALLSKTEPYQTQDLDYDISATFCVPDKASFSAPPATIQILVHGIGFDKAYWDLPFNNFNYSYTNVAVDKFGYATLAIDRFGISERHDLLTPQLRHANVILSSPHADPINTVQIWTGMEALNEVTKKVRAGTFLGAKTSTPYSGKIAHVGHSYGSETIFTLAAYHPEVSDGIILTGFSGSLSALPETIAAFDSRIASLNQPFRFGGAIPSQLEPLFDMYGVRDILIGLSSTPKKSSQYSSGGYLTWASSTNNQFVFLLPGHHDPAILQFAESTKQPYTIGELLSMLGLPPTGAPGFKGPVMILTGDEDLIFCGGNCSYTGTSGLPNIPAGLAAAFPNASHFETYIQKNTGHGLNLHYNSTGAFAVAQNYLITHGLKP